MFQVSALACRLGGSPGILTLSKERAEIEWDDASTASCSTRTPTESSIPNTSRDDTPKGVPDTSTDAGGNSPMPKGSAHACCQRSLNALDGSIKDLSQFRPINSLKHSLADHLSSGHCQNEPNCHEGSRKRQKTRQPGSESEESHSVGKPTDLSGSPHLELVDDSMLDESTDEYSHRHLETAPTTVTASPKQGIPESEYREWNAVASPSNESTRDEGGPVGSCSRVYSTIDGASPDGHDGEYLEAGSTMATARQRAREVATAGIGAQDVECRDRDILVTRLRDSESNVSEGSFDPGYSACGLGALDPQNLGDIREILRGVRPETVCGIRGDPQIMLAPPAQPGAGQSAEPDNGTDHNFYNAPCWQDTTSSWDAFLVPEEGCSLE